MLQNVTRYEKIIARAHSNYLAQISIELTQSSNSTNDVMTKLTVIGTILVPMNVITGTLLLLQTPITKSSNLGLWGMNVEVPGRDVEGLQWFFGIVGVMFVIGTFLYLYMRRNRVL